MKNTTIGVIGNPNSGKSTIFNALTGLSQKTGNWSGVTVEKKTGIILGKTQKITLIDLPGLYSFGIGEKKSIDQNVALNFATKNKFDYMLNVIDSTNIKRNLYLTLQLIERKIPIIIVLNMCDLAAKKGLEIEQDELSKLLTCPIIKISARNKNDIKRLKDFLMHTEDLASKFNVFTLYPKKIAENYLCLEKLLKPQNATLTPNDIIALMEGATSGYSDSVINSAEAICKLIEQEFEQTSDFVLVNSRYNAIEKITASSIKSCKHYGKDFSDKLDSIFLNKFLGIPFFLLCLYLMFVFAINVGGVLQDFFSLSAQATFIDIPMLIASKIYNAEWLKIVIQGIGGGIQVVASFIPIITAMYIFLSFLEDCGYIARAAVITNKLMRILGLPGQSFLPLIVGLGCNVPAITGTRILSNERNRISTIMMAPFISCTARFTVYMLFCFIFFPNNTQNVILLLYVIGIVMAIITGLLMKGKSTNAPDYNMLMELPEYKIPKITTIINGSLLRTKSFAFGAGKTIIIVFFIIHLITAFKIPIKNESGITSDRNLINIIGQKITPIFAALGIKEKNWPATVGIFTGMFAKELVVGTLVSLYAEDTHKDAEIAVDILGKYKNAVMSVFDKLPSIFTANLESFNVQQAEYYARNDLNNIVIKNIKENFDDKIAILSYLIFVLLYFPCVSVLGVISNEIGKKWAILSALWSVVSAYAVSVIFYQTVSLIMYSNMNYAFLLLGVSMFSVCAFTLRYFSLRDC
jgi:ferrous iron transport protein B